MTQKPLGPRDPARQVPQALTKLAQVGNGGGSAGLRTWAEGRPGERGVLGRGHPGCGTVTLPAPGPGSQPTGWASLGHEAWGLSPAATSGLALV